MDIIMYSDRGLRNIAHSMSIKCGSYYCPTNISKCYECSDSIGCQVTHCTIIKYPDLFQLYLVIPEYIHSLLDGLIEGEPTEYDRFPYFFFLHTVTAYPNTGNPDGRTKCFVH